ncbi:uncharacterized protein LOC144084877 isoform X2 [Stigmatopora argus]
MSLSRWWLCRRQQWCQMKVVCYPWRKELVKSEGVSCHDDWWGKRGPMSRSPKGLDASGNGKAMQCPEWSLSRKSRSHLDACRTLQLDLKVPSLWCSQRRTLLDPFFLVYLAGSGTMMRWRRRTSWESTLCPLDSAMETDYNSHTTEMD